MEIPGILDVFDVDDSPSEDSTSTETEDEEDTETVEPSSAANSTSSTAAKPVVRGKFFRMEGVSVDSTVARHDEKVAGRRDTWESVAATRAKIGIVPRVLNRF